MTRRPKIVLLGMMSKIPVAGVAWQNIHYLLGFERLGFEPWYVEAHARTPGMLMRSDDDDSSVLAATYIRQTLSRFGLGDRWAYHALHADGAVYGLSERELERLYASAELIINLHGGTEPRLEHSSTGRLVYIETDPVQLQVELYENHAYAIEFLESHIAFFTFGENYGRPGCTLPANERFMFQPTRQPVVVDAWLGAAEDNGAYTTVGNWSQPWRDVTFGGRRYTWSKDEQFRKFLALPTRTGRRFELALSTYGAQDRELLESRGFSVRHALDFSSSLEAYHDYIRGSRGEFTAAKEQNVRLRTGWFSDRSATYLAAGRPVVTQDTGFGDVLPTGAGLFAFATVDEAVDAVESIEADYARARAAAFEIAREYFDATRVLTRLFEDVGVRFPGRPRTTAPPAALPATLDLVPVSRRPTTLKPETFESILGRPIPDTDGDRLGARTREISVIVPAREGLAFTRVCLESILGTDEADLEVVVVDNGSRDGTREYLSDFAERESRIRIVRNEDNGGFARGVNQGLAVATGDVLVVLNNDTVVPPGSLARLIAHLDRPEVGLVGATTNRCGNEAEIEAPYRTYGELVEFADRRAAEHTGISFDIEVATLFAAALRRDVFESVGPLDERFELALFEDDDFSARVRAAGFRVVCAEDAFVHHFGEATLGALFADGTYGELFRANKARFEEKWGVTWEPHVRRPNAWYRELVDRVREVANRELPEQATVLVASNGDPDLLELGANRRGWHFPQMEDGTYAGSHPADSAEALAHLEALKAKGATHILFPQTAFWWLDYYAAFGRLISAANADSLAEAESPAIVASLASLVPR